MRLNFQIALIFALLLLFSPKASAQILWLKADDGVDCSSNGCTVTEWTDQTASLDFTGANNPSLTTVSSDFNFNPTISFSGTAHFAGPAGFADFSSGISVYSISKWDSLNHWSRVFDFSSGGPSNNNILLANRGTTNSLGYSVFNGGSGATVSFNNIINSGQVQIFSTQQGGGSTTIEAFKSGLSLGTGTTQIPPNVTRTTNYIGRSNWSLDGFFDGDIAELIIYDHETSGDEHRSIQSYLALKYGLTLDASTVDYTNTSFASVYNIDSTFQHGIAGLGRDTDLDQRISKSDTIAASLTVSTDTDFTSANTSGSRPALSFGQYLVWGHDNNAVGTTQTSELETDVYLSRIEREWKITDTNTVGEVNLNLTGLPSLGINQNYRLIYGVTSDFSTITNELASSSTGVFSAVDFPSGTGYFTITIGSSTTELNAVKTVSVYDPLSEGLYNLPGNDVIYNISVSNVGEGTVTDGSLFLVDIIPSEVIFYNGDIDDASGPETNPISFTQSGAGLSFTYASDVAFAGGGTPPVAYADCTYAPPTSTYEASIAYVCINPKGTMIKGDPAPSFAISFRAQVK